MSRERLHLALERLQSHQWSLFEEFASQFLVGHYPNLRTVASSSGDRGRDAELFSPDGQPKILLQYSIAKDWRTKILDTAHRISKNFPQTQLLIYVTNQSVLSKADDLKTTVFTGFDLTLDIHDIAWFLDRLDDDGYRQAASERLAEIIVDPLLSSRGILERSAPALTTTEYQAALTFLQLQWEDDTRAKGLTKLSFDALVRTVLRDTDSDNRVSRQELQNRIHGLLPHSDKGRVEQLVNSALSRLTKRYIRHWMNDDEFCLTYEESLRVRDRLATLELANLELDKDLLKSLSMFQHSEEERARLCDTARLAVNKSLLQRAELFATAIVNDKIDRFGFEDFQGAIDESIAAEMKDLYPNQKEQARYEIFYAIREIFLNPPLIVQAHLRAKSDAYTIFSFLGQTPDVQSAVSKMFSHGVIWLDTTIVLPLFAEQLIEVGNKRFTQMLNGATAAGLTLRLTPGVVEEVERHMNQCLAYARSGYAQWKGRTPFLVEAYLRSGRTVRALASWIETFEGRERPEDDLADYLEEFFDIKRESLEQAADSAPDDIRYIVEESWRAAHGKRRGGDGRELDEMSILQLVRHDVENYIGVIERRKKETGSPLGFSNWWLTLDRVARQVDGRLREELAHRAPSSPLMSADFLVNYLSIGPNRARIGKQQEAGLPLLLDFDMDAELPLELIEEAERIRRESDGVPEHVIRRRVRDHLDAAKRRVGRITNEGVNVVLEEISSLERSGPSGKPPD